jgi:hypothetical protein
MSTNLEKVELFFSAKDLPVHFHTMSTTYPFLVFYEVDRKSKQLIKKGTTDKINSLSPEWLQSVIVEFLFEVTQMVFLCC